MRIFIIAKTILLIPHRAITYHFWRIGITPFSKYPIKKNAIAIGIKFAFHNSHLSAISTHKTREKTTVNIEIHVFLCNLSMIMMLSVRNKTNKNHIVGFHVKFPLITNNSSAKFHKSLVYNRPIKEDTTFQTTNGKNILLLHFINISFAVGFTEKRKPEIKKNKNIWNEYIYFSKGAHASQCPIVTQKIKKPFNASIHSILFLVTIPVSIPFPFQKSRL